MLLQLASPLQELYMCMYMYMGSESVTSHQAEVTFPPLPQLYPRKAGTQFRNHWQMQGWADLECIPSTMAEKLHLAVAVTTTDFYQYNQISTKYC